MTVYESPFPAALAKWLENELPHPPLIGRAAVKVTPRDRRERKCPVYEADHYEINAYYVQMSVAPLDALEAALQAVTGVYATTQVIPSSVLGTGAGNTFTNPDWPAPLGTSRRDRDSLRPQVIALMKDPIRAEGRADS